MLNNAQLARVLPAMSLSAELMDFSAFVGRVQQQRSPWTKSVFRRKALVLSGRLPFVAQAFEYFVELAEEYLEQATEPFCAGRDEDLLLDWLLDSDSLTDVQRDYVLCEQARRRIEAQAWQNRNALRKFRASVNRSAVRHCNFGENEQCQVRLNPIRQWATFRSPALLEGTAPPANVLFFPITTGIGAAAIELEGQALLNELADFGPCGLLEWSSLTALARPNELIEFVRDLVESGIACVEC